MKVNLGNSLDKSSWEAASNSASLISDTNTTKLNNLEHNKLTKSNTRVEEFITGEQNKRVVINIGKICAILALLFLYNQLIMYQIDQVSGQAN